jgi:hypothetical protein
MPVIEIPQDIKNYKDNSIKFNITNPIGEKELAAASSFYINQLPRVLTAS